MHFLLILAVTAGATIGAPITEDPSSQEYGNNIEGDMIEPFQGAFSGLINKRNLWPGGVVVYKMDQGLSATSKSRSLTAMRRITDETQGCITFREATERDSKRYVLIRDKESGCSATVGYWAIETYVNLAPTCGVGSIMHEFQHTLGVFHQQSRHDRDAYVSIAYDNIMSGHEHNFEYPVSNEVSNYEVPYDYGSQMHYSEYAFSKNGQRTIVPVSKKLPEGVRIGQRDKMSTGDVAIIRAMYNC